MPTVYMTTARAPWGRFHKTPDCYELSALSEVTPRPLGELPNASSPCRVCYPDAPRLKVLRRFCPICSHSGYVRPCKHNGGVSVLVHHHGCVTSGGRRSVNYTRRTWVWPENAYKYEQD